MGKNIGKNISKNGNSKQCQKLLDHAKQCTTDALETASKRAIIKTADSTCNLIGNKIADKITRVSTNSPQNNSITNEEENIGFHREIPRERYISPEERQKIIDDLRLM